MRPNRYKWLNEEEYPFESNFFDVNGCKLHYLDEGKGKVILFVHGTPSWSFEFRNVIKELKSGYRCIAVDHIGFGLSDKPESYDYSTINHSRTLEKFILSQELKDINLVMHDFGGPIGFNFAVHHPQKVKKLIILNSWLWSSENDPEFNKISKILRNPLVPFLYKRLNFSPRFILPKSFGDKKLSQKILNQYTKPFSIHKQRNGTLAFAHSLLNDQDWFEKLWNKRDTVSTKPALFIWGMKDPILSSTYLEKFEDGFPGSETVKVQTSGHFPQEEAPDEVSNAIRKFINN